MKPYKYVLTVDEKHINAVNNVIYFQKEMTFGEQYKQPSLPTDLVCNIILQP